jgi:acetyl-CoA synthetase
MSELESLQLTHETLFANDSYISQANEQDNTLYTTANTNRLAFWDTRARDLHWERTWTATLEWKRPFAKWFVGGKLNAAANCLDVHLETERENKAAIIWEGEDGRQETLTYRQLHDQVSRLAWLLRHEWDVQKGDRVTLYMPLIPQLAIAVLACARIGAIHSVIFGGFSSQAIRDRVQDSRSEVIITADGGYRREQVVPLQAVVSEAIVGLDFVRHVVSYAHLSAASPQKDGYYAKGLSPFGSHEDSSNENTAKNNYQTHDWVTTMAGNTQHQAPELMDSEDPLFILYTSGTTGKPKGIVHSTGGYMTHAKYSTKLVFDLKDTDIYWCTADIGWITGHTYVVYGPLANGATVFMYEGAPDYPEKDRFWDLIAKYKVSIFYTAPTAIRAFMKWGEAQPAKHDLSSLRLLGSVGEPINPEAWHWYHRVIGGGNCPIVDTWWQTETGGIMVSTIPSILPMKPGLAGRPLPGISTGILNEDGDNVPVGAGYLSITEPWPSMARGIWGDLERFRDVYWSRFETYFAGDGATIDADGDIMILGRVDDVLNVAGHRIGTMEVESALVDHPDVAEAAVVGMPDEISGQAILAFVILKEGLRADPNKETTLRNHVGKIIGAIAKPKRIIITPDLPKTRSGKIMRRLLKDLAHGRPAGDTTTLANPQIVEELAKAF